MKERTSVLLASDLLQRLGEAARRRGTRLAREIESAVTRYLDEEDANTGLGAVVALGERKQVWPAVDSDEADALYGADLERATSSLERPE